LIELYAATQNLSRKEPRRKRKMAVLSNLSQNAVIGLF